MHLDRATKYHAKMPYEDFAERFKNADDMLSQKEGGKMKAAFAIGILTVLLLAILVSGCSSDTTYTPPSKTKLVETPSQPEAPETTSTEVMPKEAEPQVQQQQTTTSKSEPTVPIFKVGETATDGQLKVTVNKVRFASIINEKNNEYLILKAPAGKEYVVIDLTIENILTDKTQNYHPWNSEVVDQEGYSYDDEGSGMYLDKYLSAGEVLPNMKKRGEWAYLVPEDVTDLKFIYKLDMFEGTSVVFDIK